MNYKLSQYNVLIKVEADFVLFNTRTLALGVLDKDNYSIFQNKNIKKLNQLEAEQLQLFEDNGFIIPDEVMELELLKKEYWNNKINSEELHLSILTTLECNFNCIYCFEERKNIMLGKDIQDSVISFLKKEIPKYKHLHIDWYGGEPLLNLDAISNISKQIIDICEKADVSYRGSITTNGYYLTPNVVEELYDLKVTSAQITIDGPRQVHNERRKLLKDSSGTYDRIIYNICKAVDFIEINLRVNIDQTNIDEVKELINYLKDQGLNNINISVKPVVSADANPCEENAIPEKEVSSRLIDIYKYAYQQGFETPLESRFRLVYRDFCIVDRNSQYIIAPDGGVFKCGESYTDKDPGKIGYLTSEGEIVIDKYKNIRWLKDPFADEECVSCIVLPLCNGGCVMKKKVKKLSGCLPELRYNLEDVVKFYYQTLVGKFN